MNLALVEVVKNPHYLYYWWTSKSQDSGKTKPSANKSPKKSNKAPVPSSAVLVPSPVSSIPALLAAEDIVSDSFLMDGVPLQQNRQ